MSHKSSQKAWETIKVVDLLPHAASSLFPAVLPILAAACASLMVANSWGRPRPRARAKAGTHRSGIRPCRQMGPGLRRDLSPSTPGKIGAVISVISLSLWWTAWSAP